MDVLIMCYHNLDCNNKNLQQMPNKNREIMLILNQNVILNIKGIVRSI